MRRGERSKPATRHNSMLHRVLQFSPASARETSSTLKRRGRLLPRL